MKSVEKTYQIGPDANRVQAVLTRAGRKTLGSEAAKDMSAVEVRRAAVSRAARKVGKGALATTVAVGVAIGGGELVGYSIDHSPTTEYQQQMVRQEAHDKAVAHEHSQEYRRAEQTARELNRELPPDPNTHVQ